MAFRRTSRTRSRVSGRRSTARRGYSSRGRSRVAGRGSRRSGGGGTLRIVIEQPNTSAVARPFSVAQSAPKAARF